MRQPSPQAPEIATRARGRPAVWRSARVRFAVLALLVTGCFARPLLELTGFAFDSELFSHVLLIPLISGYLIWSNRSALAVSPSQGSLWAIAPALLGAGLLICHWLVVRPGDLVAPNDHLCLTTTAYLALLLSAALLSFGTSTVRALAFPIGFLVFMIPWPTQMINVIETGLQHASAEGASLLLAASGTPFLREARTFELPGIVIQVAQECSGVRSSYVLLITAVLGGQVLLRSGWRRWVLALAVIPLGIARNAFRILTIALLCVHVSSNMIDSPIHHRGGPLFFAGSLIPFFLLLLWLRKAEGRSRESQAGERKGARNGLS